VSAGRGLVYDARTGLVKDSVGFLRRSDGTPYLTPDQIPPGEWLAARQIAKPLTVGDDRFRSILPLTMKFHDCVSLDEDAGGRFTVTQPQHKGPSLR